MIDVIRISVHIMSSIAKLNVGGTVFLVRKDTLIIGSSFFTVMFGGNMNPGETVDGAIFIDRSGKLFEYVLNYLRNLEGWEAPEDPAILNDLLLEAQFFGLDGMIEKIKQRVPPHQKAFEIYMELVGDGVISAGYSKNTPTHIRSYIDENENELSKPRNMEAPWCLVPFKRRYFGLIGSLTTLAGLHHHVTTNIFSTSTPGQNHMNIVCTDRYNTPLYRALRHKLYPST